MMLRLFWISFSIDALICTIAIIFFFIGLIDGSVSSFNIGIWIVIFFVLAAIIFGSFGLKKIGHLVLGTILLLVLAVPGFLSGLFLFLFVVSGSSWN